MLQSVKNYLKETQVEMKRVTWPSRQETMRATLVVIGISLGVAVFLGALDFVFTFLLNRFIL